MSEVQGTPTWHVEKESSSKRSHDQVDLIAGALCAPNI